MEITKIIKEMKPVNYILFIIPGGWQCHVGQYRAAVVMALIAAFFPPVTLPMAAISMMSAHFYARRLTEGKVSDKSFSTGWGRVVSVGLYIYFLSFWFLRLLTAIESQNGMLKRRYIDSLISGDLALGPFWNSVGYNFTYFIENINLLIFSFAFSYFLEIIKTEVSGSGNKKRILFVFGVVSLATFFSYDDFSGVIGALPFMIVKSVGMGALVSGGIFLGIKIFMKKESKQIDSKD